MLQDTVRELLLSKMETIRSHQPAFLASVPLSVQFIAAGVVLTILYVSYSLWTEEKPIKGIPVIALTEKGLGPKQSWSKFGSEVITKGLREQSGCFQIVTGTGPKIILPNRFADELRNSPILNFDKAFAKDFMIDFHGFEPFKLGLDGEHLTVETVRVKLTQSLNLVTHDLVDETTCAIHDIFGEESDWKAVPLKEDILELVARLSSRVFLGKELCRNRRWLDIAKNYTMDAFIASYILRMIPAIFRRVAYWFIPYCKKVRAQIRDAKNLITPEVERRKLRAKKALEAGQKPPKTADAIGWMYEIARGRDIDFVSGQLSLTLAAVHTTTEATSQVLVDICDHPEILQPLREEAIKVISEDGWNKASLQKLRLMDSLLKESQRFHPPAITSMNRHVEREFQLSDGTVIPAGRRIMVAGAYFDPSAYPEPEKFDAFRFARKRLEPGQVNLWGHVTTSADHMGFGHGQHACPGRFFASNEVKIALCHLLLKYDWRLYKGESPKNLDFEGNSVVEPSCKLEIRRRKEEINLDLEEMP